MPSASLASGSPRDERPLSGVRVVELSAYVAAPLCGASLAELGAEVVRVDPPGGGVDRHRWPLHNGTSLYWLGLNRGKRSVCIDARTERGRELILQLVAKAGICVTNLPIGDWMSYEALRARRDDVILCTIVGNPDGTAAVDYTVNAAVGFPWITGPEGSPDPVNHVLPAWDVTTAHMAATAVVAAELRRVRTGKGAKIDLSLLHAAVSTASHLGMLVEADLAPEPRARYGNYLYGSFGRDFVTSDGRRVMVVALTPRQWRSLVTATESTVVVAALERARGRDFTKEADRFACRAELAALFEPWLAVRPFNEVRRVFDAAGVLWGPYQTLKEFLERDPRAREGDFVRRVAEPGIGRTVSTVAPVTFDATRSAPASAPDVGADTNAVLREWLGLSSIDLDALHAARVLGG